MDPHLVADIREMAEQGMVSKEICEKLLANQETKKEENIPDPEEFPDGIQMIAQALAYRTPTMEDLSEIHSLMNSAYSGEVCGPNAFRAAPACSQESVQMLLEDSCSGGSHRWLIVEAPNGYDIEKDGVILGACCYTVDGKSSRNGAIEGCLGSIRLFGILPRYKRLCIGRRLLDKVEHTMFHRNKCTRAMVCCANSGSADDTIEAWVQRRGYLPAGHCGYPTGIGHDLLPGKSSTKLQVFLKKLVGDAKVADRVDMSADTKGKEEVVTVLKLKGTTLPSNQASVQENSSDCEASDKKENPNPNPNPVAAAAAKTKSQPRRVLKLSVSDVSTGDAELTRSDPSTVGRDVESADPVQQRKMHLPPHWRPSGEPAPYPLDHEVSQEGDGSRPPTVTFLGQTYDSHQVIS